MKINWSLILKIILVLLILLVLEFGCARAAGMEAQVSGEEYLAAINADNATRAELTALWKEWEA